jgi:hypothetical protein
MLTRVLPGIVAAGIIVAGVVLWRICELRRGLPRRVRSIVVGLAAYGTATFIYAAVTGIPLRETLSGAVLHSVPYVLSGAFVGAFVVLPLGWIASVLRLGFPRFRTGSVAPAASQAIALTTCIVLLFTSLPQSRATSPSAVTVSPQDRLQALDRSLRAIEDGERQAPRDRWDPDYVVSVLGNDPQRLFGWARDNTFWIPYRGVLRGSVGVLMDRKGNSLDRAILLATLLEKAGHTVRLAHGELRAQQMRDLLPTLTARRRVYAGELSTLKRSPDARVQTVADKPVQMDDLPVPTDEDVEQLTAHYQPVADAVGARLSVRLESTDDTANKLQSRVADETSRLVAALNKPDPMKEWDTRLASAITALRDHWWVQLQDAQNWNDFDLLTDAAGKPALAAAIDTTNVKDLTPDLHHEIAIRVITEQFSNGAFTSRKALEYSLRPAEVIGQPIVLQFWPTAWSGDIGETNVRYTALDASAVDQWGAALAVGEKPVANALLVQTGAAEEPAKGGEMGGLGAAVAGALNPNSKSAGELSAVWIEYEIRVPDAQPQTVRRTVFDLLGPEARAAGGKLPQPLDQAKKLTRSLALTMRTDIQPIVSEVPPAFVQHLIAQSFLSNRKLLTAVAGDTLALPKGTAESAGEQITQLLKSAAPPTSPLLALASARLQSDVAGHPAFIGRPNVLTSHSFFLPAGDQIAEMEAVDIVANEVGVDLTEPEAFPIRIWQGVLDTNLEMQTVGGAPLGNVAEAFAQNTGWRALGSSKSAETVKLSLHADARRQLAEDLDRGYVVVAPTSAVKAGGHPFAGWWRINPATGDALGIGANGWGTTLTERAQLANLANTAGYYFLHGYNVCMAFPMAANAMVVLNERFFGGWHPSWTQPTPKSQKFGDIVNLRGSPARGCLLVSIAFGFAATLPLLLITLRGWGPRLLTDAELEAIGAEHEAAIARMRADMLRNTEKMDPRALGKTRVDLQPSHTTHVGLGPEPEPPPGPVPKTYEEAKQNWIKAWKAWKEADNRHRQLTSEYVKYTLNNPETKAVPPGFTDPSVKWNRDVDRDLLRRAEQADIEERKAADRMFAAERVSRVLKAR